MVDLLEQRAKEFPDRIVHSFLDDGYAISKTITYFELSQRAKQIASEISSYAIPGDHALMLYPSGLEFIEAFFGCLYAGIIAVPAYPPKPNKSIRRMQAIVNDADIKLVLTNEASYSRIMKGLDHIPECKTIPCISSDAQKQNNNHLWENPGIHESTTAFLQYTSGSTGDPRGVVITHKNLLCNSEILRQAFSVTTNSIGASWLPSFHDMGLIEGILQPIYTNYPNYLVPPVVFVQDPFTWLKTISDHRATHTGAPNFGFDHCVNVITDEQIEQLDLTCLENIYCGAEPVRKETMDAFAERFKPTGFRKESLYPCYGMAESTLMISGGAVNSLPEYASVDRDALEENQIINVDGNHAQTRYIANCGSVRLDTNIFIVDPQTNTKCLDNQVGEIWISGSSVSPGYYKRDELNQEAFCAYISDTNEGPFFRTGDLGFLKNGDVYVT
ncbi:fatty acyl-AMP ligase, partial [bacterium]|nr:fatty acyl-AMP ligase [bacterium]